jgi:hypothetical protein
VSDSAGDVFWWEYERAAELVAVRDGKPRWRRRLSSLTGAPFLPSASLVRDDLLVVAFESAVEGLRTSDGGIVWSRDLHAYLAPKLRKAGLPKRAELYATFTARLGRALVTALAAGRSAWLVATAFDGKLLWSSSITGTVLRMVADGDRLYVLVAQPNTGQQAIIAVERNGSASAPLPEMAGPTSGVDFAVSQALNRQEVVFDEERVITAAIAPLPTHCPPNSPSCRPPPLVLTVTGYTAGQERWHLSHGVRGVARAQLLLLRDSSTLVVENEHLGRISADGQLTPLCELPVDQRGSVVALVDGDLVVTYDRSTAAYSLPGAPTLAATSWVMHGGGPAQDWAVRGAPADRMAPTSGHPRR